MDDIRDIRDATIDELILELGKRFAPRVKLIDRDDLPELTNLNELEILAMLDAAESISRPAINYYKMSLRHDAIEALKGK